MIIISFLYVYNSKKNKKIVYIKNRIFTIEKQKDLVNFLSILNV